MTWLDRTLWPSITLLAVTLMVVQFTPADLTIQDFFYRFAAGRWLLPRNSPPMEFIFHRLPKYLVFLLVAVLLLRFFAGLRWNWLQFLPAVSGRGLLILLLTLAFTPSLVALGKQITRSHCPWAVQRYGGPEPYVKPLSRYDECCPPSRRGACWPAGHASAGFALVALASLAHTSRGRMMGVLAGLFAGAITGIYQMMKGAHYFSDTLTTMFLAWILHLLLRRAMLRKKQDRHPLNTVVNAASP